MKETRASVTYLCCVTLICLFAQQSSWGQRADWPGWKSDSDLKSQGFVSLFDGSSLDKWDVKPWHEGHWVARDGLIDYDGKSEHRQFNTNSLWTKDKFTNTKLYVEWRLPREPRLVPQPIALFNGDFLLDEQGKRITRPRLDAGDSGLLFRGILNCQANIWCQELGSGEVNGYRTNSLIAPEVRRACIPLRRADRPMGEWNAFLITLRKNHMTVTLNGEQVVDVALPELPTSGPIGLQHHGDPVQFRRIWVKPLD